MSTCNCGVSTSRPRRGKSPYPLFPEPMQPPFNVPPATGVPTMDGFAVDYYANFCWEKGRAPTEAEMRAIGGMFTRETAPVINRLAAEFAGSQMVLRGSELYLPEPVLLPRRDQPQEDR